MTPQQPGCTKNKTLALACIHKSQHRFIFILRQISRLPFSDTRDILVQRLARWRHKHVAFLLLEFDTKKKLKLAAFVSVEQN